DYVLKAVCPNLTQFQELMQKMLDAELGVDRYMTYIVTRSIKSTRPNISKLLASSMR
ncbi:MAG: Lrp/AsnC ligand binding domain-containing protein, partial [Marivita lacus]|nr:Lrp/AsnC ligand binding domain-containing protein [Marivita lacus]